MTTSPDFVLELVRRTLPRLHRQLQPQLQSQLQPPLPMHLHLLHEEGSPRNLEGRVVVVARYSIPLDIFLCDLTTNQREDEDRSETSTRSLHTRAGRLIHTPAIPSTCEHHPSTKSSCYPFANPDDHGPGASADATSRARYPAK